MYIHLFLQRKQYIYHKSMLFLITDDFATNRIQAGLVIKAMGHSFEQASNGEEAIEKLKKKDYDLILMDIEMPVRNGLEATRYIRENFKGKKGKIPVIAITAHYPGDYHERFAQNGFSGLIAKPLTREKLEKILKDIF